MSDYTEILNKVCDLVPVGKERNELLDMVKDFEVSTYRKGHDAGVEIASQETDEYAPAPSADQIVDAVVESYVEASKKSRESVSSAPSAEGIVGEFEESLTDFTTLLGVRGKRTLVYTNESRQALMNLLARHGDARYAEGKREAWKRAYAAVAKADYEYELGDLRAAAREDGVNL
jgi:hypothetical protein